MSDATKPTLPLLMKLGSIIVHADEYLTPGEGHEFDLVTMRTMLADPEVKQWVADMGVYLPAKRNNRASR